MRAKKEGSREEGKRGRWGEEVEEEDGERRWRRGRPARDEVGGRGGDENRRGDRGVKKEGGPYSPGNNILSITNGSVMV